jgi:hypothetical protein
MMVKNLDILKDLRVLNLFNEENGVWYDIHEWSASSPGRFTPDTRRIGG